MWKTGKWKKRGSALLVVNDVFLHGHIVVRVVINCLESRHNILK